MDLSVEFCGKILPVPFIIGAGVIKTVKQCAKATHSDLLVGGLTVGGITKEARGGNVGTTFHYGGWYALNSLGLPNGGLTYYEKALPEMVRMAQDGGKILIVNLSGFTPNENYELASAAVACGVKFLELNVGCPNALVEGTRKPVIAFDRSAIKDNFLAMRLAALKSGSANAFGIKSTHYSNPQDRRDFISLCREVDADFVTACNTVPDCSMYEAGNSVITANHGYAGLSGKAVMPSALAHLRAFSDPNSTGIEFIGMGGIDSGEALLDYLVAGATIGGATTEFYRTEDWGGVAYRIINGYMERRSSH